MAHKNVSWHYEDGQLSLVFVGLMACVTKYFAYRGGSMEVKECCAKFLLKDEKFRHIVKKQPKVSLHSDELVPLLDRVLGHMKKSDDIYLWGTTQYMDAAVRSKILAAVPGHRKTRKSSKPPRTIKRPPVKRSHAGAPTPAFPR